jgi:Trk-type K+ transport system membrane component
MRMMDLTAIIVGGIGFAVMMLLLLSIVIRSMLTKAKEGDFSRNPIKSKQLAVVALQTAVPFIVMLFIFARHSALTAMPLVILIGMAVFAGTVAFHWAKRNNENPPTIQ